MKWISFIKCFGSSGAVMCMSLSASGATFFVDSRIPTSGSGTLWSSPKKTIQEALALAGSGDRIHIGPGTYKLATQSSSFELESGLSVQGGYAGYGTADPTLRNPALYVTILSGDIYGNDDPADPFDPLLTDDNAYHVVVASGISPPSTGTGADRANLDGVTITGGHAQSSGTLAAFGAGIYMENSSAVFRGCIIKYNHAMTGGGGVWSDSGVLPVFRNCKITNNLGGKLGGGIYMEDYGRILNCEISENSAGTGGGVYAASIDEAKFINVRFSANEATGSVVHGYNGGGLLLNGSGAVEITNCQFDNNDAGLGVGGGVMFGGAALDMTNCTFAANHAAIGGGMGFDSTTSSTAINCIFWDDTADSENPEIYSSGSLTVTYSDVEGGWAGTGNINTNPSFVTTGNYRLQSGSDCVDAGQTSSVPADGDDVNEANGTSEHTPDRDLLQRVRGAAVDQGAFEHHSCAETTCCADVNCDGVVNIVDLVLVITGWGHPSLGDVVYAAGSCGANGTTDIDDLVMVITSWSSPTNPCIPGSQYNAGSFNSVQDCIDAASEEYTPYSQDWNEFISKCTDALCARGIINCD